VIAANVLHATSNIRHTVRNAKAALKKHGWLLLNEITGTSLFSHLTFGLLPGWWAYEDPEWRVPGSPALTTENWQAVLNSEGFGTVSHPTWKVQEAGQQVIVAESDGVVRQPSIQTELTNHAPPPVTSLSSITPDRSPFSFSQFPRSQSRDNTGEMLREKSIAYLKGLVGKVLNLPSAKIDAAEPLTNYGLDSILVLRLTETLRTDLEHVSGRALSAHPEGGTRALGRRQQTSHQP